MPGQHGHLPVQPRGAGRLAAKTDYHDFGKEIFPASIRTHKVQMYLFDGYWEDIGTIRSFYEANLALAAGDLPSTWLLPLRRSIQVHGFSLPTRIHGATIRGSLMADGCDDWRGAVIENSVVGLRAG